MISYNGPNSAHRPTYRARSSDTLSTYDNNHNLREICHMLQPIKRKTGNKSSKKKWREQRKRTVISH